MQIEYFWKVEQSLTPFESLDRRRGVICFTKKQSVEKSERFPEAFKVEIEISGPQYNGLKQNYQNNEALIDRVLCWLAKEYGLKKQQAEVKIIGDNVQFPNNERMAEVSDDTCVICIPEDEKTIGFQSEIE